MAMKPYVLINAKIAKLYVGTDAELTVMGFEITDEEMVPSALLYERSSAVPLFL
jgi:hypothetical protein